MPKSIVIENLSKRYVIGHQRQDQYSTFRDVLMHKLRGMGQRIRHPLAPNQEEIEQEELWALRNINLEIEQGERVGIIGRNGAGKSTLLKVLSRITEPTTGRFTMTGRVSSLLEVGTGFHPELSGKENIFLNGAILGMSKIEIKRKFDEIVSFAETEKFLDTPVKRYSSGMYVRLAFAVAAHLEPEILIVDEVLAVGDTEFQKKCLGKMEEIGRGGRTVLFVSHNMAAIQKLCPRAILIHKGEVVSYDDTSITVEKYLSESKRMSTVPLTERTDRQGSGDIQFEAVYLRNSNGDDLDYCITGNYISFHLKLTNKAKANVRNAVFAISIDDYKGNRIAVLSSEFVRGETLLNKNVSFVEIIMPKFPFLKGEYTYTLFCRGNGMILDWIQNAGSFLVEEGDYYGTGRVPTSEQGSILIDYKVKI